MRLLEPILEPIRPVSKYAEIRAAREERKKLIEGDGCCVCCAWIRHGGGIEVNEEFMKQAGLVPCAKDGSTEGPTEDANKDDIFSRHPYPDPER